MDTEEVHDLVGALATRRGAAPSEEQLLHVEVLVRRGDQAILMVQRYRDDFVLPGGEVRPDETAVEAARRQLREETGLARSISRLLAVDQSEVGGPLTLVFDGGMLMRDEADSVALPSEGMDELVAVGWIPATRMHQYVADGHTDRVAEALLALRAGNRLPMLLGGKHVPG